MNIDHFIKKFEAIPDDLWTVDVYRASSGRHCALGHCGESFTVGITDESRALENLFSDLNVPVSSVNDGKDSRFQQPTPKQRILAALNYLKNEQV